MSWRSRPRAWIVAVAGACGATRAAPAQAPPGWREAQLWGVAAFSRPAIYAGGFGLAWRDGLRTRVGIALAGGADQSGAAAGRGELVYHFLLDPTRAVGNGVYLGGGLAVDATRGSHPRPFVEFVVGAENQPAGRRGTFVEAGFGGGARVALGIRWRKRNAPSH